MSKIDQLTPLEEGRLWAARRDWGLMHFRPIPADRPKAEAACHLIYRQLGRRAPPLICWFQSPLAARLGTTILEQYFTRTCCAIPSEPPRFLRDSIRSDIGLRVLSDVWDHLAKLRSETDEKLWDRFGRPLVDYISIKILSDVYGTAVEHVHPRIVNRICAQGPDLIRWCEPRDDLYRYVGPNERGLDPLGHLDNLNNWLAFACYETFSPYLLNMSRIAGIAELWKEAGGWCPYREAVFFVERPCRTCFDDQDQLHSSDGMALAYPDGSGLYMWHGVTVPKEVILCPDALMPFDILHERNVEVRRIMIERYGVDHLLAKTHPQCLDVDQGGQRALYQLRLSHDEPIVAVKVRCPSTNQVYFLRVPPAIRTCRAAVAWTFGFERADEYQPMIET